MSTPTALLTEAGSTLARAEGLIQRAGQELGPPFVDPFDALARDVAHLRRRVRNASTTATTTAKAGGDDA